MPIRVGVVEDDARVRESLIAILEKQPDFASPRSYASGEELLANIERSGLDVVLMDINLPGLSGVECVQRVVALVPETQIIVLTIHIDLDTIFEALSVGAVGYLVKPVRAAQLTAAIRDVFSGGAPMTSSIARKVIQAFHTNRGQGRVVENLSPREQDILDHLSRGYLYKEIASMMEISYATVRTHIERIYHKLHVQSRSQAVARYLGRDK